MPTFPVYQRRQGLGGGATASYGSAAPFQARGRALQGLGGAIEGLGNALDQRARRIAETTEDAWFSRARAETGLQLAQQRAEGADPAALIQTLDAAQAQRAGEAPSERAAGLFGQWTHHATSALAGDAAWFKAGNALDQRGADFQRARDANLEAAKFGDEGAWARSRDDLAGFSQWATPEEVEGQKAESERLFRIARAEHAVASDPQGFLDAIAGGNDERLNGLGDDERRGLTEQAAARLDAKRRETSAQRVADIARQSRDMLSRIASGDPAITAHAISNLGLPEQNTQKLQQAFEAKQAQNAQVDDVFRRLNEGSTFNPKDTNERLAVSKAYEAAARGGDLFGEDASDRDTALYLAGTTGIVPDAVLSTLRGAFASDDPARIAAATRLAADLNEASPDALADAGASAIGDIGTEYTRLTTEMGLSPEQAAGRLMSWLRDAAKGAGSVADLFLPTTANAAVPRADGASEVPRGSAEASTLGGSPATGQFSPNAGEAAPESAKPEAEIQLARMMRAPAGARRTTARRSSPTTLRQEAELEALRAQRDKKVALVREHRPNWKPPAGLYEGPEGLISQLRDEIDSADRALADISRRSGTAIDPQLQESLHTNDPVDRIYSGESEDPDGLKDRILSAPSPEDENHWTEDATEELDDGGKRTRFLGPQGAVVEETLRQDPASGQEVTSRSITLPDGGTLSVETTGDTQRIIGADRRPIAVTRLGDGIEFLEVGEPLTIEEGEAVVGRCLALHNLDRELLQASGETDKYATLLLNVGVFEGREYKDVTAIGVRTKTMSELRPICSKIGRVQNKLNEVTAQVDGAGASRSPQERGRVIHKMMEYWVNDDLQDPSLKAEISVLDGRETTGKGSVKPDLEELSNADDALESALDIFELSADGVVCVYDYKTGKTGLSKERMLKLAAAAARHFSGQVKAILVIEMRPYL